MKTIFTIGYEGTDIDRFVKTLVAVGIDAVADVRAVPLSRKKGFSKNVLRERLAEAGIDYLPLQTLGDPKPGREAAKAGNYEAFRAIYSAHIDQADVRVIVAGLAREAEHAKVCLLCFERDPKTCHRMIVGERMEAFGFSMMHLYGDDPQRYDRNRERLLAARPAAA